MTLSSGQSTIIHWWRFACSQMVLLSHLLVFFQWEIGLIAMGSYAVLIFFVLSGFLIARSVQHNYLHQKEYSFRTYLRDRFFRIYPPFIAALVLVFVLDIIAFEMGGRYYSLEKYLINFFINIGQLQEFPPATFLNEHYMIELFRFQIMGTDIPLWTISIEWWLYVFYGYLMFKIIRNPITKPQHWILLLALSLTPLYYMFISTRMSKGLTLFWFLGTIIATSGLKSTAFLTRKTFALSLLIMTAGTCCFFWMGYNGAILLFFLGLYFLMQHGNIQVKSIEKTLPLARLMAGYSYSLYLIHYSLIVFIMAMIPLKYSVAEFWLIFIFVNLSAFGFAYLFEQPTTRWKKRYENYRSIRH
jgi:peptidoglycan/LPS O-acetylase OafA/YrhL